MVKTSTNKPELTGAFDLFPKSYAIVTKNWKIFGLLYILPLLSVFPEFNNNNSAASLNPFANFSDGSIVAAITLGVLLFVVFVVLSIINQGLLYVLELQTSMGKNPTFSDVWARAKGKLWRFVGLSLIVGLTIAAGLLLFIIPGLIFIRRYILSAYYMFDKNLSISDAMKQSSKDSKPYAIHIWSIIGVMILLSLIAVVPVIGGLLSLVLVALYSVAPAIRYQELKKLS